MKKGIRWIRLHLNSFFIILRGFAPLVRSAAHSPQDICEKWKGEEHEPAGPLKTEKAGEVIHFTSPFHFYGHRRPRLFRIPSGSTPLTFLPRDSVGTDHNHIKTVRDPTQTVTFRPIGQKTLLAHVRP